MKPIKEIQYFEKLLETPENDLVKQAVAAGRHAIGYNCFSVPEPLLEVGPFFGVRMRAPQVASTEDANYYLGAYLCSYSRSILQAMLEGQYRFLDGMVFTVSCVHIARAGQHEGILGLDKQKDPFVYHVIEMPRKEFEPSTEEAVARIRRVADDMAEKFDADMSDGALCAAIAKHNEFTRLLKEISDFRLLDNPPITGTEWHTVYVATKTAPHDLLVEPLQNLKAALESRKPDRAVQPRVMVMGSTLDNPAFTKLIEDQGCRVVADRYCFGSLPGMEQIPEEGDPYENLIRHYLATTECPRMMEQSEGRFDYAAKLLHDYRANGVIFETMKFCDLWGYEAVLNLRRIKEAGVPVVRIEREYQLTGEGQFATRVQAFVESLAAKGLY
jgi:benzoyl-CoA reductase/2-hydroxyglutaryl-CoA dehydratase subunit BcrC/BadD/HgdB